MTEPQAQYETEADKLAEAGYVKEAVELLGMSIPAPRKIITEISGFTPIFDAIIENYHDETIAAVFGIVWRHCQMEDGVCRASLDTLADYIGVDRVTVMRHVKRLCEDRYLKDLTPDLKNRPHVYAETGRISMKQKFGVTQSNTIGMTQRNAAMTQSHLSKDSNKESNNINKRTEALKRLYQQNIGALVPLMLDLLRNAAINYPDETWYAPAFELAVTKNARNWTYIETVLKNWKEKGRGWSPAVDTTKAQKHNHPSQQPAEAPKKSFPKFVDGKAVFDNA